MADREEFLSSVFNVEFAESFPILRPFASIFLKDQVREFKRIIELFRGKKIDNLILDLSGCQYISSDGLGAISSCWKWCHDEGRGRMAVVLSREKGNEVINLFEITGISTTMGSAMQRTVKDALNYLKTFY